MKIIRFTLIITIIMSLGLMLVGCNIKDIPTDVRFDDSDYVVTFEDNFDGDSLDTTKWRYFTGQRYRTDGIYDKHTHRGGYYSNDADIVHVDNGALHITTRYKSGQYGEGWYSAWIETTTGINARGFEPSPDEYVGFEQKYGYFEVCCICPPAEGLWSAFWIMPNEGHALSKDDEQWTAKDGAEIDVMESPYFFKGKSYVQHVVHCDYGTGNGPKSDKSPIFIVPDMYSTYHTYGVEWTPQELIFYIDGYRTYATPNVYKGKVLGTPDVLSSLILSVEVAGHTNEDGTIEVGVEKDGKKSWLGSANNMSKDKSYDFVVDYVKVMQKRS